MGEDRIPMKEQNMVRENPDAEANEQMPMQETDSLNQETQMNCEEAPEKEADAVEQDTDCPDKDGGEICHDSVRGNEELGEEYVAEPVEETIEEPAENPQGEAHNDQEAQKQSSPMELLSDQISVLNTNILSLSGKMGEIAMVEEKTHSEIREIHKLYHNEYAGRLRNMQAELDDYRKIDKGRVFDDILGSIARIYNAYETLPNESQEPKVKKSIKFFLMDLMDLLEAYGVTALKSNVGDKRDPRHCQIQNRLITEDPLLHDTVAKSFNTGFHAGNRTIIYEKVDSYYFTKPTISKEKTQEGIEEPQSEISLVDSEIENNIVESEGGSNNG